MNYVITGSLGHISKPLVQQLVQAKHQVTVITSRTENATAIEALGATAAVGSIEDATFITNTFAGADAVYLMIPPKWTVDNWYAYQQQVADNYVAAVKQNNIPHVVLLSSIGAHLRKGAGPIDGLGYLEEQLNTLTNTHSLFLRPSYFFYNLFSQIDLVKNAGIFGSNFSGNEKLVLVDTNDIAAAAAKALLDLNFKGQTVQYISTIETTGNEVAAVLGKAIGKEGTPWVAFTDEQSLQGMLGAGLPQTIAEGYIQLGSSLNAGLLQADYWKTNVQPTGNLSLEQFAQQFAAAYNK